MVEWWQAVTLLLAGGLIGLASAYVQRRWTAADVHEAEDRERVRRVQEDERQARRQHRKDRIQPVVDFLDTVKRYSARDLVEYALDREYEVTFKEMIDPAEWAGYKKEMLGGERIALLEIVRQVKVAAASAPTAAVLEGVVYRAYWAALADTKTRNRTNDFDIEIRGAEQTLEDYIVGASD